MFFFTRQSLVSQDQDENADVYDAREDGGLAAQSPAPPEAPCENETCRAAPGPAPAFGTASSATLSGTGNLPPAPSPPASATVKPKSKPVKCKKGFFKKKHKCVRKPKPKKKADKSAHTNRSASR